MAGAPATWRGYLAPLVIKDVTTDLNQKLGEGSFGIVYKAVLHNGMEVAAKQLNSFDSRDVSKFVKECQLMKSISKENSNYIVRFFGVYFDETSHPPSASSHTEPPPQLIMELMEASVYDCISPTPPKKRFITLNRVTITEILLNVAQGLNVMHRNQLVHRDLNPGNVLLKKNKDSGVTAKISDFGLCRRISGTDRDLTKCPGCFCFMPPEAILESDYTEKIDIYSFGVLALYTVTEKLPPFPQPPFDKPSARESLPVIMTHELFPLIERCLTKRYDFRPTAAEAAEFLSHKRKFETVSWNGYVC